MKRYLVNNLLEAVSTALTNAWAWILSKKKMYMDVADPKYITPIIQDWNLYNYSLISLKGISAFITVTSKHLIIFKSFFYIYSLFCDVIFFTWLFLCFNFTQSLNIWFVCLIILQKTNSEHIFNFINLFSHHILYSKHSKLLQLWLFKVCKKWFYQCLGRPAEINKSRNVNKKLMEINKHFFLQPIFIFSFIYAFDYLFLSLIICLFSY